MLNLFWFLWMALLISLLFFLERGGCPYLEFQIYKVWDVQLSKGNLSVGRASFLNSSSACIMQIHFFFYLRLTTTFSFSLSGPALAWSSFNLLKDWNSSRDVLVFDSTFWMGFLFSFTNSLTILILLMLRDLRFMLNSLRRKFKKVALVTRERGKIQGRNTLFLIKLKR